MNERIRRRSRQAAEATRLFRCEGCGADFPAAEVVDLGEPIRTLCKAKCLPAFLRPEIHLTPAPNRRDEADDEWDHYPDEIGGEA